MLPRLKFKRTCVALAAAAIELLPPLRGTPSRIRRFQRWRLRRLLEHAARHVPHYREALAGLDLRDPDLSRIAPVSKRVMMERFDEFVADPEIRKEDLARFYQELGARLGSAAPEDLYFRGKYVVTMSSGTSGTQGLFVHDYHYLGASRTMGRLRALGVREALRMLGTGLFRRVRWAFVVVNAPTSSTYVHAATMPGFFDLFMRQEFFSVSESSGDLARRLERYQPEIIYGYSSAIEQLAIAQLEGKLRIRPRVVSTGSEETSARTLGILKRAFPDARITSVYSTTEGGSMAILCPLGNYHLNEDYCVVEAVDADGHPVPAGRPSDRILLTNLTNRVQPIIRYELSDSLTIRSEACGCGNPAATIGVEGRAGDWIQFSDARGDVHSHSPIQFVIWLAEVGGLKQYQLVHERQNQLVLRYSVMDGASREEVDRELRRSFDEYLSSHGLPGCVTLELRYTSEEIARDPRTKKLRQVLSLVPPLK